MKQKIYLKGVKIMRNIVGVVIAVCMLTSCYTQKPICDYVEGVDGSLIEVKKPAYKVKLSLGGMTTIAGAAAAGGYVGNSMNTEYIGNKYNSINTAIGAAVGMGIAIGVLKIIKPDAKEAKDPVLWMRKANNNYAFAGKTGNDFYGIPYSAENVYSPNTLLGAKSYSEVFPHSSYRATVVEKVMPLLSRDELIELDSFYPESGNSNVIRKEYIMRAKNTCDYIRSVRKYPNVISDESETAKQFLSNFEDVLCFNNQYPAQAATDSFEDLAIPFINSSEDVSQFLEIYPETSKLELVLNQLGSSCTIQNYCEFYEIVNEVNKQMLHYKMFEDASTFSDFNYIAKTLSGYTEEAILASQTYIESYGQLRTADSYDVLTKSQINNIINKAYLDFSFNDLIAFASDYPDYPNKSKIEKRSIEKAGSIKQCKAAADAYPSAKAAANDKAYAYAEANIKSYEELKTADSYDVLTKSQINNIIDKTYLNFSFDDLIAFATDYPDYPNKSKLGKRGIEKAGSIKQCKTVANTYPIAKEAASNKASKYAKGSIEKSEEFLDAFPKGSNAVTVAAELKVMKTNKFNEFISEAETAIDNDEYWRSENALAEAEKVMPDNSFKPTLSAVLSSHNSSKKRHEDELVAKAERQRQIDDAKPWEYNGIVKQFRSNSENMTIGTLELIKPSGRTMTYEFYYHHDSDGDGTQDILINGVAWSYSVKWNWITNYEYGTKEHVSPSEAIKWAAERIAND